MTITATVDTSKTPTVHVTIGSPDGSPITACTLYRNTGGVTELTRTQPYIGVATLYFDDVEAGWDTGITYTAAITYGAGTTTLTSAPVTVSPGGAWAIHPTNPPLSVCLDTGTTAQMGIAAIDAIVQASKASKHDIIDSPYPVLTRVGPRASPTGTLTVSTVTATEEARLRSMLYDETPLLIRIPSSWGWGWEDGFYAIGEMSDARFVQYGPEQRRTFTLPYQRVQPPAGDVQTSWSYTDLEDQFADYGTVLDSFADYSALYADIRSNPTDTGSGTPGSTSTSGGWGATPYGAGVFGA